MQALQGLCTDPNSPTVATLGCIPIIISNLVFWLLGLVAIIAVMFVIYGGAKFILSGGDPKQVEGARKTITYALIGLALVLLSFAIISLVSFITGVDCIQLGPQWTLGSCQPK